MHFGLGGVMGGHYVEYRTGAEADAGRGQCEPAGARSPPEEARIQDEHAGAELPYLHAHASV